MLDALSLGGVLSPIQHMIDIALSALPNLVSAAMMLAVGWFAARVVQRVLTNLLAASGLDRAAESARLELPRKPSELVGFLAYALILIPASIAGLNQLGLSAVTEPAGAMLHTLLATIPHLLGAAMILCLSYFAGKLVSGIAVSLLASLGFDSIPERLGLRAGQVPPSLIAGRLTMIALMAFAT